MTPRCDSHPQPRAADRRQGIALLVVMVVFVVLYLVVYQLHFSTKMEEHIAQARYGEGESTIACYSAALFVITHLIEDLKSDTSSSSAGTGAPADSGPSLEKGPGEGVRQVGEEKNGVGGTFSRIGGAAAPGAGKAHDSLFENIFQENRQQVGEISVKISMVDGERTFDLNRLFDYVRLKGEDLGTEDLGLTEDDMVGAVEGKDGKDAELSLSQKVRQKIQEGRSARTGKTRGKSGKAGASGKAGGAAGGAGIQKVDEAMGASKGGPNLDAGGTGDLAAEALSDYEELEFVRPEEQRIEATRAMVERAILMMFSINENEYGYKYSHKYDAGQMAQSIVDYVLARKDALYQRHIYLVSELLNLSSPEGRGPGDITPEVFYGPYPQLAGDDEVRVGDGFLLKRDEFGDIVPEYEYGDVDAAAKEEEKLQLEELEKQLGQFADFGGLGLSRLMSNPLTRGMQELPIAVDQNGEEYVVEVPKPIGLKDLFTTFSTGKININTASVPVIFGLLQSLSDAEANLVALNIRDYRKRFQEEVEDTGIAKVGSPKTGTAPDLGQPKRRKKEKDEKASGAGAAGAATAGAAGLAGGLPGVDPSLLDPSMESSYQDLDLNYFTSLEQIELIDGTDGGPDDLLRRDEGVKKVSEEDDTLYRRVIHDLEKVAVFGSTYFNAELKAKPKEGRSVKTGYLTVRRDVRKRMVDVVLWKNLQK